MNPALKEEEEEPHPPEPVPKSGTKEVERGKKDKPVAEGKRGEGQEGALGHVCGCCLREGVRGGCVAMSEAHCFILCCVCVCVRVCVRACACMHACMHACVCVCNLIAVGCMCVCV